MKEKQQTTVTKTKPATAKTIAETKEQTNKGTKKKESKNILISNLQVRDVLEVDFTEFA